MAAVEREFGSDPVAGAMGVVERLKEDGLLSSDGKTVRLTAQGRLLSNFVFAEFLGLEAKESEVSLEIPSVVSDSARKE